MKEVVFSLSLSLMVPNISRCLVCDHQEDMTVASLLDISLYWKFLSHVLEQVLLLHIVKVLKGEVRLFGDSFCRRV